MTNELVALSQKIDADRLKTEAPIPDQELAYRAAKYFPEEKARVFQQTDKALEGIKSLVKVGAMTPEQGANLGAQLMAMRDKILGAVPNDALYDQKRAVADPLQKTYDTSKNLVNRATDAAFFNVMGMEKLAEKYPKTGEAVGKFFLEESKLAQKGAVAIGAAGTAYFLVTATITTAAAIGTLHVVKNVLEYVGVSKEASTFYAAGTSFLVAAKVGTSETVQTAETTISKTIFSKTQSAWSVVENVFGNAKQLVTNERGSILNPAEIKTQGVESKALAHYWPRNRGFLEPLVKKTLSTGDLIDRYGLLNGKYASPEGTPFEMRSLPPTDRTTKPYTLFKVVKPFEVEAGKAAPAFGQIGQGMQYALPKSVQELIEQGYLRKVVK